MTDDVERHLNEVYRLKQESALKDQKIAELEKRNGEVSMLAYKWMAAHDDLAAGKPVTLPTPADVPNTISQLSAAQEALNKHHRTSALVNSPNCYKCGLPIAAAQSGRAG